ncbi:MAG TPA: MerR family transcriptional regulator, partial [Rhodobiaceae bacterium]|nr:MerR family transcriptional regulator [Rhodobiaceae bacterium]
DVELIAGIKHLLQGRGMTIRGTQKYLKENGIADVRALASGEKPKVSSQLNEIGRNRRSKLEAARQNLVQARILLVGEDG